MIAIRVYLRTYTNDNSGIVWISFYLNREKITISTKVSVDVKNWNEKKQRVTSGDKQAADKNRGVPWRLGCDPQLEKLSVWRRLTPELSRPARGEPGGAEAAKRARLERIVRHAALLPNCRSD